MLFKRNAEYKGLVATLQRELDSVKAPKRFTKHVCAGLHLSSPELWNRLALRSFVPKFRIGMSQGMMDSKFKNYRV